MWKNDNRKLGDKPVSAPRNMLFTDHNRWTRFEVSRYQGCEKILPLGSLNFETKIQSAPKFSARAHKLFLYSPQLLLTEILITPPAQQINSSSFIFLKMLRRSMHRLVPTVLDHPVDRGIHVDHVQAVRTRDSRDIDIRTSNGRRRGFRGQVSPWKKGARGF